MGRKAWLCMGLGLACLLARAEPGFTEPQLAAANQAAALKKLDVGSQYAIYRQGSTRFQPPATYLASIVAEGRQGMLTVLTSRLQAMPDEAEVRDIVIVVDQMVRYLGYDVQTKADVLAMLRREIGAMRGPAKRLASDTLADIELCYASPECKPGV